MTIPSFICKPPGFINEETSKPTTEKPKNKNNFLSKLFKRKTKSNSDSKIDDILKRCDFVIKTKEEPYPDTHKTGMIVISNDIIVLASVLKDWKENGIIRGTDYKTEHSRAFNSCSYQIDHSFYINEKTARETLRSY